MLNLDAAGGSLPMCSCPFPGMNVAWIESAGGDMDQQWLQQWVYATNMTTCNNA